MESLHASAIDLANRGRLAAAERILHRVAARTDDSNLSAHIAGTLALTLARRGAIADAERICRAALATPGLDDAIVAILAGQLGSIAEQAGRLDDADRWLGVAIDSIPDAVQRANLLMNRSLVSMQRGDLDRAADDVREAARSYAASGMSVDVAEARHNLGYIDLLRGDLVAGLHEMNGARTVLAASSAASGAISDLDRAEILRDAGLTREAESLLQGAASVFGASRMPKTRAEAEFSLARSLLTHDPVAARRVAETASRRFRRLGNDAWATRADALRLRAELSGGQVLRGGIRAPTPRWMPTASDVEASASALDRHGFRNESAALRLTHELARARRAEPGRDNGRSVKVPANAPIEVRLLSFEVRAARSAARGRHAEVRRHAARGLDDLTEWQSAFGSLDLQTSIVMHGNGLIGAGLASAVRSGRPDVVFEWSERARHLSLQVVPLRPPPDPALAAELSELRQLRSEGEEWFSNPRAAHLRERARERQWSATGSAEVQERVSLDDVRGALDADTCVLSYVFSGDALSVLVVTAERAQLVTLPPWSALRGALPGLRADLDMAASVRGGPLANVVRASLEERLAVLSTALLREPVRAAGSRRIVVTAPGVLNGIPWAMLPGMRGRAFTLASSATQWVRLRGAADVVDRRGGFAVGPRVLRGDEEAAIAASTWSDATILRDAEATVAAVTDLASRVDVLHIAAHGRHAVDNPLFSGLELADGALFGYDIDLIPKVPDTVILSACEVGRSSVRWGEEAIGMTRIWLHAGARCVIASPVVVADDVACELLGAMHEGLARGEAPAEALAAASERTGIIAPFQAHGSGF